MMKFAAAGLLLINAVSAFSPSRPAVMTPKLPSTQLMGEFGASSTSFYTTTEKKESYESLDDVLTAKCKDPKVRQVIRDMLEVCAEITEALRTALVTVEGSMNDFGDAQLSVDVSTVDSFVASLRCSMADFSDKLLFILFLR
jgi:sedoheptulose-bisphosphatase